MELSDYINLTLDEIVEGVKKADKSLKKRGGHVLTSAGRIEGTSFIITSQACYPIIKVAFRVGVEVEESKESNHKLGGSLKVISTSFESLSGDGRRNTHEVSFELPLILPIEK